MSVRDKNSCKEQDEGSKTVANIKTVVLDRDNLVGRYMVCIWRIALMRSAILNLV